MSDHHYNLLLPDAADGDLDALHARAVDWLVGAGIVERELTDCILAAGKTGHRPARAFMRASGEPEDPRCGNMNYAGFIGMKVNGLQITRGRTITPDAEGSYNGSFCPRCGGHHTLFDGEWNAAADAWLAWREPCNMTCVHCGAATGIADWKHDSLGFGALVFTFWNWPPLGEEFQRDLAQHLGQRIVHFTGSL